MPIVEPENPHKDSHFVRVVEIVVIVALVLVIAWFLMGKRSTGIGDTTEIVIDETELVE